MGTFKTEQRSYEEIAGINGEELTRANRFEGEYDPLEDRMKEGGNQQQPETIEDIKPESEGKSQIVWSDNLPIVDLKTYNTEGEEPHFIQINQVIDKITGDNNSKEEMIEKAEFNFSLKLKTLIATSATELNTIRDAIRQGRRIRLREHVDRHSKKATQNATFRSCQRKGKIKQKTWKDFEIPIAEM